jgi:hypothetical protein
MIAFGPPGGKSVKAAAFRPGSNVVLLAIVNYPWLSPTRIRHTVAHLPTIDEFSLMDPVTHGLAAHAPDLRGAAAIHSIPHRSQATEAAGSG